MPMTDLHFVTTIVIQVVSIAYVAGVSWQRIGHLEKDILRLEQEVIAYRLIREDLAAVKAQLTNLQETMIRILGPVEPRHHA